MDSPKKARGQLVHDRSFLVYLALWYFFSGTTLFLNKYVISYQEGDALFLGVVQMTTCSVAGYVQLRYGASLGRFFRSATGGGNDEQISARPLIHFHTLVVNFFKFFVIGFLRFFTVVSSLIALWYIPVSFAELIKSSAPLFTVIIAVVVLKESSSWRVLLSLMPIMLGLGLCSAFEIHFHYFGFGAAAVSNLSECFQNVLSKRMLTREKYSPAQIQFFTSVYSTLVQLPYIYYFLYIHLGSLADLSGLDRSRVAFYLLAGISFHLQSLAEYALLAVISPVTHSVANAVKRATLIWLSVLVFGNPVTLVSWFGTFLVISGIFAYNHAIKEPQPSAGGFHPKVVAGGDQQAVMLLPSVKSHEQLDHFI